MNRPFPRPLEIVRKADFNLNKRISVDKGLSLGLVVFLVNHNRCLISALRQLATKRLKKRAEKTRSACFSGFRSRNEVMAKKRPERRFEHNGILGELPAPPPFL